MSAPRDIAAAGRPFSPQRAGDIVTRAVQPHVYVALSGASYMHNDLISIIDNPVDDGLGGFINQWFPSFSGQKVWPPGPLVEKDRPGSGRTRSTLRRRSSQIGRISVYSSAMLT